MDSLRNHINRLHDFFRSSGYVWNAKTFPCGAIFVSTIWFAGVKFCALSFSCSGCLEREGSCGMEGRGERRPTHCEGRPVFPGWQGHHLGKGWDTSSTLFGCGVTHADVYLSVTDKPEGNVPILPRGFHQFPFKFQLPESSLPCSFESKPGFIRYYIKVIWISDFNVTVLYQLLENYYCSYFSSTNEVGQDKTLNLQNILYT